MRKIFIILLLMYSSSLISQTITQTIRGRVVDKESKQTLPGATVILLNSEPIIGVSTDSDGEFIIKNIPIGRQSLSVSFIGYHPVEVKNLLLQSGKEAVVDIELTERIENLSEVEIKSFSEDGKAMNEMALISARSFSIEQTERFAGSLGDPARMVGNYAGVVMQNDARNDIIIRGNSPIGVIWRLDDIEIPNPNHFGALGTTGGPVSMLNNNLLTNSDFFTGAFPAEFGNGISGAFDLRMRSGNNQKTEYTGQIGFNGFEFGVEGPFSKKSKASYIINARYSTLALMHEIGFGTGTGSAVPYYKDLTFKVDLPTKTGKISAFGIFGDCNIDLGADIGDTTASSAYNLTDQRTQFAASQYVVGISHLHFFNNKTRIKTTVSSQNASDKTLVDIFKINENKIQELYRGNNNHSKLTIASHIKSKINNRNSFSTGIYVSYNDISLIDSVFANSIQRFTTLHNTDGDFITFRPYAQYQYKFNDNLSIYGGVSGFANTINQHYAAEPRAGLEWMLSKQHSLSFGFGKHSQLQPASVYFTQHHDTINNKYSLTNTNLAMTKADHFVIGHAWQISNTIRLKTETYYQNIYNVPVTSKSPEFSMINAGEFFNIPSTSNMTNEGKGQNYGLEITFEKFLKDGYYILLTGSIFDSKYTGHDGVWRNTAFNNNYIINLLSGYEFKIKNKTFLTFDIKSTYSGGKRYIPIDLEESISRDILYYDLANSYLNKLDDYFRLDLRIGIKLNGKRMNQEWGIDLQNLTNNQAAFQQAYDSNKKQIYYTYQQGFYPMFLYRINF